MRGAGGVGRSRLPVQDSVERIVSKRLRARSVAIVGDAHDVAVVGCPQTEIIAVIENWSLNQRAGGGANFPCTQEGRKERWASAGQTEKHAQTKPKPRPSKTMRDRAPANSTPKALPPIYGRPMVRDTRNEFAQPSYCYSNLPAARIVAEVGDPGLEGMSHRIS